MGDDAKVAHVRAFIRSRKVRVVVACQDTRLAYRVFEGLSADECRLVEHGGVVEEVSAIPKDRTARYIGVSQAIRAAAAAAMPDPAAAVLPAEHGRHRTCTPVSTAAGSAPPTASRRTPAS